MQNRQLEILRAIVDEYVATEEPVGSKVIAEKHGLGVSPATIRNDMAVLEDAGLIKQPHTSAGRIPTNSGYRMFVDKIAEIKPLSSAERRAIENFLDGAVDLDDVFSRTAKLLAQITKQVAVIQYPDEDKVVLLRLLSDAGTSLQVKIGEEQGESSLKTTSLVSMSFGSGAQNHGALGILGPTRMDYASSMAAVNTVARYISGFLGDKA